MTVNLRFICCHKSAWFRNGICSDGKWDHGEIVRFWSMSEMMMTMSKMYFDVEKQGLTDKYSLLTSCLFCYRRASGPSSHLHPQYWTRHASSLQLPIPFHYSNKFTSPIHRHFNNHAPFTHLRLTPGESTTPQSNGAIKPATTPRARRRWLS